MYFTGSKTTCQRRITSVFTLLTFVERVLRFRACRTIEGKNLRARPESNKLPCGIVPDCSRTTVRPTSARNLRPIFTKKALVRRTEPRIIYLPGDLEQEIGLFIDCDNNVTPADVYHGRHRGIISRRERIKRRTLKARKLYNLSRSTAQSVSSIRARFVQLTLTTCRWAPAESRR